MRHIKKRFYFTLVLIAILGIVAIVQGCSSSKEANKAAPSPSATDSNTAVESAVKETPTPTAEAKKLDFPKKPITLVVWGATGSGTDVMGRMISNIAQPFLGQPVVVVNKTGGSGVVAMNYSKGQPSDGYTANVVTATLLSLIAQNKTDMPELVIKTNDSIEFIVVRANSPLKTIEDLIEQAKANPGKLTIGGSLAGSFGHQFVMDFSKKAGIELNYVPYDGTSETITAALSGEVDIAIGGGNFGPQISSGAVRALASNVKASTFPDVPALGDKGIPDTPQNWRAISVNPGTPPEIIDYLHNTFKQVFETDQWKTYLEQSNEDYIYTPRETLQSFVESQVEPTREYLKSVGLME